MSDCGACGVPCSRANATAVGLGTFDGDTACGFLCPSNTAWELFATRTGSSTAWFRARALEFSATCTATIEHQIRLIVPPGMNYDLYVYCPCGTLVGSSTLGAGQTETVTVSQADGAGDSSFDYWVEVRYVNRSSCSIWMLQLSGHNC